MKWLGCVGILSLNLTVIASGHATAPGYTRSQVKGVDASGRWQAIHGQFLGSRFRPDAMGQSYRKYYKTYKVEELDRRMHQQTVRLITSASVSAVGLAGIGFSLILPAPAIIPGLIASGAALRSGIKQTRGAIQELRTAFQQAGLGHMVVKAQTILALPDGNQRKNLTNLLFLKQKLSDLNTTYGQSKSRLDPKLPLAKPSPFDPAVGSTLKDIDLALQRLRTPTHP